MYLQMFSSEKNQDFETASISNWGGFKILTLVSLYIERQVVFQCIDWLAGHHSSQTLHNAFQETTN